MNEDDINRMAPSLELMIGMADYKGNSHILEVAIDEANKFYEGIPNRDDWRYKHYCASVKLYYDFLEGLEC